MMTMTGVSDGGGTDTRQQELLDLQKEYRKMELMRRAYAEESQALLRKQQSTVDKLRKDNDGLKNEIAMVMRGSSGTCFLPRIILSSLHSTLFFIFAISL